MFHKRKYIPVFPEKYTGDPTNIIMRSSWETRFASWCDKNPSVVKWSSEETVIPYRCSTDNRIHRYFIDFKITVKDKNNKNIDSAEGIIPAFKKLIKDSKMNVLTTDNGVEFTNKSMKKLLKDNNIEHYFNET